MIKFAGKLLPSYVKVLNIKYAILPTIESKTQKIMGRGGSYDFGIEIGEREIELEIMIIADNQNDILRKARDLTSYLYYKDLKPLILLDEPDKQYMARFVGDSEVTELYRTGKATLRFLCPSPYAESITTTSVTATAFKDTPIGVDNNGTAEAFPIITLTMKENASSISVITNDKHVTIGNSPDSDEEQEEENPLITGITADSYAGWSTALEVDNGEITGTFNSNGFTLRQADGDYGTGASWHGASGIRAISKELQDFSVDYYIGFESLSIEETGRMELYLLDANNEHIGKIALHDSSKSTRTLVVEARAGNYQAGHYFMRSSIPSSTVDGKFYGVLRIYRKGKKWGAYLAFVDENGVHSKVIKKEWTDTEGAFNLKKLAKVQIHTGAFSTRQPVKTMYVVYIGVYELKKPNTSTPVILKKGDKLTIDNTKAIILKNGEPFFQYLDPSSDFFGLNTGINGIVISPPVADVNIKYKERWL